MHEGKGSRHSDIDKGPSTSCHGNSDFCYQDPPSSSILYHRISEGVESCLLSLCPPPLLGPVPIWRRVLGNCLCRDGPAFPFSPCSHPLASDLHHLIPSSWLGCCNQWGLFLNAVQRCVWAANTGHRWPQLVRCGFPDLFVPLCD